MNKFFKILEKDTKGSCTEKIKFFLSVLSIYFGKKNDISAPQYGIPQNACSNPRIPDDFELAP